MSVGLGQPALSFRGPCSGPRSPHAYWVPALGDMLDAAWLPEAGGVPAAPVSKMRRLRLREVNLPGVFPQGCWGHDLTWEGLPPPRTAVGVMAAVEWESWRLPRDDTKGLFPGFHGLVGVSANGLRVSRLAQA